MPSIERLRERARRRDDRGAALVEIALVAPILVVLGLLIVELGFAWRQNLYVERAAQTAARTAASSGADLFTDFDTLQSVASTMGGADNVTIERVIVFDATTSGEVPNQCLSVPATGLARKGIPFTCNVYSAAQVNTSSPGLGFPRTTDATTCPGSAWDWNWCPMRDRDRELPGMDRVGVYIEVSYDPLTGLFPNPSPTFTTTAVFQLEPTYVGRD